MDAHTETPNVSSRRAARRFGHASLVFPRIGPEHRHVTRRALLLLLAGHVLTVLDSEILRAQTEAWREFRWDDLGFRIEMPGTPIVDDEKPLPTDHWTRMLDVRVEYEQIFLGLAYIQFKQRRSEEEWFTTFVRTLSSVGATITETPVSIDGFRGREIFSELFDVKATHRTFALRNNAFVSITAGASRDNPNARRFLDSMMLFRS